MLISIGIIITAVIATVLILLQERSSGSGGAFGGGDAGGFYQQRRGVERMLFILTVVAISGFVVFSLLNLTHFGNRPEPVPTTDSQSEAPATTPDNGGATGTVPEGAPAPSPEEAPVQ